MQEGSTNLSNRLPEEQCFVDSGTLVGSSISIIVILSIRGNFFTTFFSAMNSVILFFNEVGCTGSLWSTSSSLFLLLTVPGMDLTFSFLEECLLLTLTAVEHLNIDLQGVVKIGIIPRSGTEESGEDTHDLSENIWFQSVDTCPEILDKSVALDCDPLTRSESVYACNFAICTNRYGLQRPDTKAPGNTTERKGYDACNEITRVKLGGVHDLT